ncbi:MAG: hypothetical protein ACYDAE_06790 [Steroidobacteraceae bacterium]
MSTAKHLPCCDGMDPAMDPQGIQHSLNERFDCATMRDHPQGCASAGHCVCGQPLRVVQVTARGPPCEPHSIGGAGMARAADHIKAGDQVDFQFYMQGQAAVIDRIHKIA